MPRWPDSSRQTSGQSRQRFWDLPQETLPKVIKAEPLAGEIPALGPSACATDRPVQDTEAVPDGPADYGKISVSADQQSAR